MLMEFQLEYEAFELEILFLFNNEPARRLEYSFVEASAKIFAANKLGFARRIPDEWAKHPGDLAAEKKIRRQPDKKHPSRNHVTGRPAPQKRQQPHVANNSRGRDKPSE